MRTDNYKGVLSYLTRVALVKTELEVVQEIVYETELVKIALKGFTKKLDAL